MKKNTKVKTKKIYIIIFITITMIISLIAFSYFIINNKNQEAILKEEIINLANKDLLIDNYDINIKTTGDYAYIEETIKKYYKKISDNTKIIDNYLTDKNLINILSAKTLESDGPNFENSYQILIETKEKANEAMQTIIDLCNEDTIKNLIDKDKVSNSSYELYLSLMYQEYDLEELTQTKNEIQTINNNLNTFLNKVETILNLLKDNSDYWFIDDEQLYFEKDSLVKEYNNLYNDLNKFVTENFSTTTKTSKTGKTRKTNI